MQAAIPSTKIVTKIEANPLLVSRENEYRQLRVAAYCRVSNYTSSSVTNVLQKKRTAKIFQEFFAVL